LASAQESSSAAGARKPLLIAAGDGVHRNQIEVDFLRVRLVDANAVEKDADALRLADDRRDDESTKVELGLEP
jgi:hypothetical protein